jgi:hypothetical protein
MESYGSDLLPCFFLLFAIIIKDKPQSAQCIAQSNTNGKIVRAHGVLLILVTLPITIGINLIIRIGNLILRILTDGQFHCVFIKKPI